MAVIQNGQQEMQQQAEVARLAGEPRHPRAHVGGGLHRQLLLAGRLQSLHFRRSFGPTSGILPRE
jgi:hypothetical protein